MKLLKSMTTSNELSLRLKELGVEQKNGEYYWERYMDWVKDENGEYNEDYVIEVINKDNFCFTEDTILCRAFTLGELVREIKGINVLHLSDRDAWWAFRNIDAWGKSELDYNNKYTTPEEAAGELYYEILKSKL